MLKRVIAMCAGDDVCEGRRWFYFWSPCWHDFVCRLPIAVRRVAFAAKIQAADETLSLGQ